MHRTLVFTALATLTVAGLGAVPDAASGAAKPNLTVTNVAMPVQSTVGQTATFKVTVRSAGAAAPASKLKVFLSNDARPDSDDVALGTIAVNGIGAGATRTVEASFAIPDQTGPHRVIACADSARTVAESDETDNCKVTRKTIWIHPKPTPYVAGTPNPRDVTPTLANASKTASIGPAGGSITMSSGGDKFVLTVPPKALVSTTEITLRPVTAIAGLGMSGGLLAAVEIAPAGLTLLQPATLTITPDASVERARQAGFAYLDGGDDLHAVGLQPGAAITLKLRVLSGAGVGDATASDRTAQQARIPADADARLTQQLAPLLDAVRAADAAVPARTARTASERALAKKHAALAKTTAKAIAYIKAVAVPALKKALAGDTVDTGLPAIQKFLAAARQLALLGVLDEQVPGMADAWELVYKILDKLIPDAHKRCVEQNDPGMALFMLAAERTRQLMGAGDSPLSVPTMNKCLSFEVDFEWRLTGSAYTKPGGTKGSAWGHHMRAEDVPVQIDILDPENTTGEGVNEYLDYWGTSSYPSRYYRDGDRVDCTGFSTPAGTIDGRFRVLDLGLDLNYYRKDPRYRSPFRLEMRIDVGQTGLDTSARDVTSYTTDDPHCPVPQGTVTNWLWTLNFYIGHYEEVADDSGSSYLIQNMTPGATGSDVLATKIYDQDVFGEGDPHELTSLVLRHTPKQ